MAMIAVSNLVFIYRSLDARSIDLRPRTIVAILRAIGDFGERHGEILRIQGLQKSSDHIAIALGKRDNISL